MDDRSGTDFGRLIRRQVFDGGCSTSSVARVVSRFVPLSCEGRAGGDSGPATESRNGTEVPFCITLAQVRESQVVATTGQLTAAGISTDTSDTTAAELHFVDNQVLFLY